MTITMDKETQRFSQILIGLTSAILSFLFAGNVYFVKRLVDKLDVTEQTVWELKNEIAVLKITLSDYSRDNCHKNKARSG